MKSSQELQQFNTSDENLFQNNNKNQGFLWTFGMYEEGIYFINEYQMILLVFRVNYKIIGFAAIF